MDNSSFQREESDVESFPGGNQDHQQDLGTPLHQQITFAWEKISVETVLASNSCIPKVSGKKDAKKKKTILNNVSGYARPGEILAIMGASGSGKSSLLNSLTFRNLAGLKVTSGKRYANGKQVNSKSLTSISGYVQQHDLFIGTLTVKEHLVFQAKVRMDPEQSTAEKMERVNFVIKELGLKKCENTMIGIPGFIQGISGGEQKRLSFAAEILTNPRLLFCDEPTSGLDAFMAQSVVQVLERIAKLGKTLVLTIHQPSSQVFNMIDKILLMSEGRVAFLGSRDVARDFFNRAGYPCPASFNPSDHYINVLAVVPGREDDCKKKVSTICDAFDEDESCGKDVKKVIIIEKERARLTPIDGEDRNKDLSYKTSYSPYKVSRWKQFQALLWRSCLATLRNPIMVKIRLFQTLVIGIILGLVFFNQGDNEYRVMNIQGAIFIVTINLAVGNIYAVVNVFCGELPVFLREHLNGMYSTDTYYVAKQLAEIPVFVVMSVIFSIIFYFMVGLNPGVDRFFFFMLIMILLTQVGVSLGYLISCIAKQLDVALSIAPIIVIPFAIFGGILVNSKSLPDWLSWFQYLSWFLYTNEATMINQWQGLTFNCSIASANTSSTPPLCFPTGEQVLEFYGYHQENFSMDLWILLVFAIVLRTLGYIFLLLQTFTK